MSAGGRTVAPRGSAVATAPGALVLWRQLRVELRESNIGPDTEGDDRE